jgi:hypothetical protein
VTSSQLVLGCSISGFESNLPSMDYDWTINDALVPHSHSKAGAAALARNPAELIPNPKYDVELNNSNLSLVVKKPSRFYQLPSK